ncbi:hypothetical protein ZOSMA_14G00510 [Zostera marina]|uniref:Uncharacterized protein n=1 Tax=Zostera marina TaxID=29655 RepID=A0A0K9PYI5_ZOSMR|nr:hypothetical protein ZOSMA_14G00510 [Zostera marina]
MEECRKVLDEVFGVSSSDSNDTVETSSTSSVSPQTMDVELKCEESCLKSMEEYQRVLEDVFGASDCNDTDDDDSPSSLQSREGRDGWEMVKDVEGLSLCRQFLSSEQQSWLLSSIDRGAGATYFFPVYRQETTSKKRPNSNMKD